MGDNLYIAREFSKSALADVSMICDMPSPPQNAAAMEILNIKLAALQSGAKRLRARAIYQSAQGVIDILLRPNPSSNDFSLRVSSLSRLLVQYENGLSEVETQLAQNNQAQGSAEERQDDSQDVNLQGRKTDLEHASKKTSGVMPKRAKKVLAETKIPLDLNTAYADAKQNLESLTSYAKPDELSALLRLMSHKPECARELDSQHGQKPAAHETENRLLGQYADPAENFLAPTQQASKQVSLEHLMSNVVQDALSIARMCAKTISISYDMKHGTIGRSEIVSLERRLCEGLRALIMQSLPQGHVGHIDIRLNKQTLIIQSKYPAPKLLPKGLTAMPIATGSQLSLPLKIPAIDRNPDAVTAQAAPIPILSAELNLERSVPELELEPEGLSSFETTEPPRIARYKPMITPDNEQNLRLQLGNLMDWSHIEQNDVPAALGNNPDEDRKNNAKDDIRKHSGTITNMADAKHKMNTERKTGHDELGANL